jgi:hypothetical protein
VTEVALYSALYGAYEYVKPLPGDLGCRAILYTDEPGIEAPGWEVRVVTDHLPVEAIRAAQLADPKATDGMLRHKYWKCHPAQAVPDADVTIWADASLLITADSYAKRCLEALGDDDWCAVRHPWRDCIYTEAAFSATLPRYNWRTLDTQVQAYRLLGHPRSWGLFATGANVRRHTPVTIETGEHWWWEIVTRSHQDQVSLPVIFRLMQQLRNHPDDHPDDRRPLRWNVNMPWNTWWGVYEHGRPG